MRKIVWSSRAEREYLSIIVYWNKRNKSTLYSKKLIAEVRRKEKYILQNPTTPGIIYDGGLRCVLVFDHYSLIYKIIENYIYVASFWDSRKNPASLDID